MAAIPSKQYLDAIRNVRDGIKVTYPYGGTTFPRCERVYAVPKGQVASIPTSLPGFTGSTLVQLEELARDDLNVEVYLRYDTLPGPALTTTRLDDDGVPVTVTRQRMLLGDIVTGEDLAAGTWTRTYKADGDTLTGDQVTESRAVPGNPKTTVRFDEDSETFITTTRQLFQASTITPATSFVAGTSATKIEREDYPGSTLVAYEVTTVYPNSSHNDLGSAKVGERLQPKTFPARVDLTNFLLVFGVPIGLRRPQSETVKHTIREYWVIANSEPSLATDDILYGDTMYLPNGFSFGECIHDAATIVYPTGSGTLTVNFPATTPSYTVFTSAWIGTDRVVGGSVDNAGHPHRWKVTSISVPMR